ncbi:MAG: UDP-glucose/GDP-mannose dehydrogenase family protein [Proteobacteria bacterium]|nr:UDP-glucose/GDP-mannose dehydrogenase family protein [Pseudomonadota bacterium]
MKVCVVGTGYVGIVSGAGFAEAGNDVVCVDVDEAKVNKLNRGETVIYEPGLEELLQRNTRAGRLQFTTDLTENVAKADVVFIGVGTPSRSDGAANLMAVDKVAEDVARAAIKETVLVLKSTVPVGTNTRVRRIVGKLSEHPIHVVSNPEFLKEGDAVNDFMRPDRIIVGCDEDDTMAREIMWRLYHPYSLTKERILWMDPTSAELSKYVANTMLAMRVSFMNEVAALCERVGADVHRVRMGAGSDERIGGKFLFAGPGYGGSCFPKDVKALVETGHDHGVELELCSATDRVNQRQKGVLLRKLKNAFEADLRGRKIALWGIAFKPRTDDIRESPALTLIEGLRAEGASVAAHDPAAAVHARTLFGDDVEIVDDQYDAVEGAEALVLVTEWKQYLNPDFDRIRQRMKRPLLIDGRNMWSGYGLRKQGFLYDGIGVIGS